uniref:Uncharacterized protein n=1 Tax=Glossina palpalis gambiensis TaxID=67801 RepID=A0A1B0B4P6_9MUSC
MSGSAEADDGDDGDDYDDDGDDAFKLLAIIHRISACLAAICHKMSPNVNCHCTMPEGRPSNGLRRLYERTKVRIRDSRWRKRQIPGNKEKWIASLFRSLPPHMLHTYILIKRLKLFLEASFAHLYIVMLAVACLALKCIF